VLVSSCGKKAEETIELSPAESDVSLVRLLGCPEKYENRFVTVCGFVHLEFESNSLYLTEEHFKNRITKNALHLWGVNIDEKAIGHLNHRYVRIKERFKSRHKGQPLMLYSGYLYDIQDIMPVLGPPISIDQSEGKVQ
jgi:hypothetical protein